MNRPQVTPELIATVAATFCSINGPVLVWAHDNHPHEMAAFIGPPEAVINV